MTTLTQDLIDRGLKLSPEERERFANLLLDSLEPAEGEVDTELQEELQRRWDRYESGEDRGMPVEDFLAELRQRIDARKGK